MPELTLDYLTKICKSYRISMAYILLEIFEYLSCSCVSFIRLKYPIVILLTSIFRFREELSPSEPVICVTHPVLALKILRNFGHLILDLSVDYILFYMSTTQNNAVGDGRTEPRKLIEDYMAEYCSETLCQLSLQNGISTTYQEPFEDIQKQFTSVKTLRTESCFFGEKFSFNKLFPKLQTLQLGNTCFKKMSTLIVRLPTVKYVVIDFTHMQVENLLQKFFKLNPQLENPKIHLPDTGENSLCSTLQKNFPNVKETDLAPPSPFEYNKFIGHSYRFEVNYHATGSFQQRKILFPESLEISNRYKNDLQNLYVLYRGWKN